MMLLPCCRAEAGGEDLALIGSNLENTQERTNERWMQEAGIVFPALTLKCPSASGKSFHAAASVSPLAMQGSAFCREEAVEQCLASVTLTAGDVQHGTVHGWHPEVGGASVKDHGEILGGCPDADHTVILGLQRRRQP